MQEPIPNLVSIIIPLYNAETYITRALDSVCAQTYHEFEIIIVDDGSTDCGYEICKGYSLNKEKLQLLKQKNSGPGTARNFGLQKAQGEFIFFLDADDYIDKLTLESTVSALRKRDSDLVIVEEMIVTENGKCSPNPHIGLPHEIVQEYSDSYFCKKERYLELLVNFRSFRNPARKIFYPCKGRLYKNSIIRENNITFPDNTYFMEDLIFQMQYCSIAKSLTLIKKAYYYYQLHNSPASITSKFASEKFLAAAQLQYRTTIDILTRDSVCSHEEAKKSAAYAIVDDMLVNAIRSSQFVTIANYKVYYRNLANVVRSSLIQQLLRSYVPLPGQSKLIPLVMRIKSICWLLYLLKKKGANRYQKQEKNESTGLLQ